MNAYTATIIMPGRPCTVWFDSYAGRTSRRATAIAQDTRQILVIWDDEPNARFGPASRPKGSQTPVPIRAVRFEDQPCQ